MTLNFFLAIIISSSTSIIMFLRLGQAYINTFLSSPSILTIRPLCNSNKHLFWETSLIMCLFSPPPSYMPYTQTHCKSEASFMHLIMHITVVFNGHKCKYLEGNLIPILYPTNKKIVMTLPLGTMTSLCKNFCHTTNEGELKCTSPHPNSVTTIVIDYFGSFMLL